MSNPDYSAKIIADSVNPVGDRLTTFELCYPRFVHAELMTHRMFCLAGDAELEFDLPAGQQDGLRRVYKMSIAEFVGKWLHGSAPHKTRWGGVRTYDLKSRLREMRIRQLNEATGGITISTVTSATESGMKPVYEVHAGKYSIAGSADHRIMTDDGWRTIGELSIGDSIVVRTQKKPEDEKADPLRLKFIDGRWRSVWQREMREKMIQANPRCRMACGRLGVEIHHRVLVCEDPSLAFEESNITLLCTECHGESHTQQGWQTGNPLYSGLVTVDGVRYRGVEPTYDLAIAGPFPNFIANGVVVHNSRNSASSRAIPTPVLMERIRENPVMPKWWGKNQSGMQAREELTGDALENAKLIWLDGSRQALALAERLREAGLHKQIANRVIEPWMFITVIVTATEYDNWFRLRDDPNAQPEIAWVAREMRKLYESNKPVKLAVGEWHLPYVEQNDANHPLYVDTVGYVACGRSWSYESFLRKISVARCARVSYLTHDGVRDYIKDIELHDKLTKNGHWSPFEHVAEADGESNRHGNFIGWRQYRKMFKNENHGRKLS